jgi:Mg-chelatase subunit ChlI
MESREFTIEHDDKTYEFIANLPNKEQEIEAQRVYNRSWKEAVKSGCMLKDAVISTMIENGLWSDKQEDDYRDLIKTIAAIEYKLNSGKDKDGKKLKLSEGNELECFLESCL